MPAGQAISLHPISLPQVLCGFIFSPDLPAKSRPDQPFLFHLLRCIFEFFVYCVYIRLNCNVSSFLRTFKRTQFWNKWIIKFLGTKRRDFIISWIRKALHFVKKLIAARARTQCQIDNSVGANFSKALILRPEITGIIIWGKSQLEF